MNDKSDSLIGYVALLAKAHGRADGLAETLNKALG
jgi:hypothetical protein